MPAAGLEPADSDFRYRSQRSTRARQAKFMMQEAIRIVTCFKNRHKVRCLMPNKKEILKTIYFLN